MISSIGNGCWLQEETAETRPILSRLSISLIFYRMWRFDFDKFHSPVSISFQQHSLCVRKNIPTCGVDSMSRLQEHIFPSVETVMRLWAFWVPTTLTQYTGCCESISREDQVQLQQDRITSDVRNMTLKQGLKSDAFLVGYKPWFICQFWFEPDSLFNCLVGTHSSRNVYRSSLCLSKCRATKLKEGKWRWMGRRNPERWTWITQIPTTQF